ncbi:MAG: TlpA family protein disulfide reductase [Hyphomonadaceae bacterium]|nr:TlpA family protein disulfide reductase [Hyphomonadaceae bacterium]
MDTRASSSETAKPWALWAALAMLAAGLVALLYVLFAAASKPEADGGLMHFATGEMRALAVLPDPPPMSGRPLKDAEGREVRLSAFSGEVLVVNLWATWCAPCIEEMPTLGALQRRMGSRLRVIPISVDTEGDREKAQSELARLSGGSLPFLIDISRGVLFDVRAPGMPVTIVYDRQGREVARLAGGADWNSEEAAALLEAVLSGE